MPRKGAKNSRQDDAALSGSVAVAKGSITTADDPTALEVKLSIWATEITMRAEGAELGNWPTDAVVIRPIDASSFEFIAEGDRLIFTPENPDEFGSLPVVASRAGTKKRRRSRATKKKAAEQPAQLRWDESTDAEAELRRKQAQRARSKDQEKQPKQAKPSRAERRAAKAAAQARSEAAERPSVDGEATEPAPIEPAQVADTARPDNDEWIGQFGAVETPVAPEPSPEVATASVERASVAVEPSPAKDSLRHRTWIRTIDFAREYDLFGLDRVQVTPEQRQDPNHSHTWNHRVAPTSGPGKYVCTICGAWRRNS